MPHIRNSSQHRRFIIQFLVVLLLGLVVLGGFNAWVDPFDVLGHRFAERFDDYRGTATSRITTSDVLRRPGIDVLLVGSSRVEVGLDPHHPAFDGLRAYNAGMSGCWLEESLAITRFALRHQRLTRLILVVDFNYWQAGQAASQDFALGRHHPGFNRFDHMGRLLWGGETTEKSLETLRRRRRGQAGEYRAGLRLRPINPPDAVTRHIFQHVMADRQLVGPFAFNPGATTELERVLEACRAAGVQTSVVIAPTHAVMLVNHHVRGAWDDFERWKRDLTAAVERVNATGEGGPAVMLWDFATFDEPNTEPVPATGAPRQAMHWYWDPGHFRRELGDRVLGRITGHPSADDDTSFGTSLDTPQLESHLDRQRRQRDAYMTTQSEDAAIVVQRAGP